MNEFSKALSCSSYQRRRFRGIRRPETGGGASAKSAGPLNLHGFRGFESYPHRQNHRNSSPVRAEIILSNDATLPGLAAYCNQKRRYRDEQSTCDWIRGTPHTHTDRLRES